MFFCAIVAFIIAIAFYFVLFKTKLGKAIRATSDNPDLAKITGINTEKIILYIWFIGGILAATSGILISVQQAIITPVMGWKILIPLFAAVIVGGIGNPIGALMGGLLIGITGELATGWINPSYKPAVYFLVLLIVLLLRPNGIWVVKAGNFNGLLLYFLIGFFIMSGIYSVFSVGPNIHWGHTGLFNIGIASFFLLGSYTAAIISSPPPSLEKYEEYIWGGNLSQLSVLGIDIWFPIILLLSAIFVF
ncbi:MAG: hypothetical protein Ct9H90mP2_07060 [Dehalococcoidia bacterium]|nr:MAG: hypothetical protein Ct9H90mP2_07060 [Dehalococcoidia bacterium]